MESIDWLKNVLSRAPAYIDSLKEPSSGGFRYSQSGNINKGSKELLMSSVFATKVYYMVYALDASRKMNLESCIRWFEHTDGTIFDPLLLRKSFFPALISSLRMKDVYGLFHHSDMVKRAETRQSFAALLCLGVLPATPYRGIPETVQEMRKFLRSLSWHLPWSAGSHVSHVLFFLCYNRQFFGLYHELYDILVKEVVHFLASIQSTSDGLWYRGSHIDAVQKINGAMKILTGFSAIDYQEIPLVEKMIDSSLLYQNNTNACSSVDALFVLYFCSRYSPHRKNEVVECAVNKIQQFKAYYYEGTGGFSFYRERANTRVYGAEISSGKNEADIHGTVLYVWGLTMIAEILGLKDISYRQPIT